MDKASLAGKIGKAVILDNRAPAFLKGKEKLPFVPKAGRIKGAVNLPVGQLFTPEGLYKDKAALKRWRRRRRFPSEQGNHRLL